MRKRKIQSMQLGSTVQVHLLQVGNAKHADARREDADKKKSLVE